jgi:hypothetical protein
MSTPTGTPQYSADGKWWWDGQQWLPVTAQAQQPLASQGGPASYGYGAAPYPGVGVAPMPPQTGTDGKAVASLVLGIVWLGGLGSIIAVILGHVSRSASRKQGRQPSGVALAGVILGYIGIAGITSIVLLSTLAFHTVKTASQQFIVKSDLRDASVAEEVFNVDHSTYTNSVSDLQQYGFEPDSDVTVSIVRADASGYCLVGALANGNDRFYYSSEQGDVSTVPCT